MPSSIKERISRLAGRFAEEVVAVVASLVNERLDERRGPGRPPLLRGARDRRRTGGRRSREALNVTADRVVAELVRHSAGLRAEKLRANLGMARSDLARPIMMLLAGGRIRKTGEKRRTTYFVTAREAKVGTSAEAANANRAAARAPRAKAAKGARSANGKAKATRGGPGKAKAARRSPGKAAAKSTAAPAKKPAAAPTNGGGKAAAATTAE